MTDKTQKATEKDQENGADTEECHGGRCRSNSCDEEKGRLSK